MPDSGELRSEMIEVQINPSASDPGFSIVTSPPDDIIDASVMAISEIMSTNRKPPTVHDFGPSQLVIPDHQKNLQILYGNEIPEYAIDTK